VADGERAERRELKCAVNQLHEEFLHQNVGTDYSTLKRAHRAVRNSIAIGAKAYSVRNDPQVSIVDNKYTIVYMDFIENSKLLLFESVFLYKLGYK